MIAPHEGRELEYVCLGIKPIAHITKDKDPKQFQQALTLVNVHSIVMHSPTELTITKKENKELHDVFVFLSSTKADRLIRTKEEKNRLLGRLFGYTEEEIDAFIKADMKCACGQCKFGDEDE